LFIIFINDLDDGVISKNLKFADYTKIISKVANKDLIKSYYNQIYTRCSIGRRTDKCCSIWTRTPTCSRGRTAPVCNVHVKLS